MLPQALAPRPILHPVVCQTKQTKAPHLRGFRPIAGERFGLMGNDFAPIESSLDCDF